MKPLLDVSYVASTWSCLSELEVEYLRIGRDNCNSLSDGSQLSAVLMLSVRAVSLLRGMLKILDRDFLDAYDPIRRAFIETTLLAYYFRLKSAASDVQRWLQQTPGTWQPDFAALEESNRKLTLGVGSFAKEFNMLAEVAHPTLVAAQNSVAIATTGRGYKQNSEQVDRSLGALHVDFLNLLNRQIWLTLVTAEHLVELPIVVGNLQACIEFHQAHTKE